MNIIRLMAAFCIAVSLSSAAIGDMSVDKMVVNFFPGKGKSQDIVVSNNGNEVLYVQVTPEKVTDSALPTETREIVRNPIEAGLLVSPRRIVLQPGDSQVVRLVRMRPFQEETVFRVDLKPVTGELQAEQTGVKIMVGYNLIVFVSPQEMNTNLTVKRDAKRLSLINSGNVNVDFRRILQCESADILAEATADDDRCMLLSTPRLYPGRDAVVELPYDQPVRIRHYSGGDYTTVTTD